MKLTREQAIEEHRKMWNWIAEHVEEMKPKDSYELKEYYVEKIRGIKEEIYCYCFCCVYDAEYKNNCSHCPLDWGNEENNCLTDCNDGLYDMFRMNVRLSDYKEASVVARKIANLPGRKIKED